MLRYALISFVVVSFSFASARGDNAAQDTLLVVNKLGDTLSLIDPATGKERARVDVGEGPHEVAASPDGRIAVVTNYGRAEPGSTLSVIDVADGRVVRTIDLEKYHRPHGIAFLPDGKRVAVTAEQERKLLIVNVQSGEVEHAIDTDQDISHMVALSRDAKTAYVANIRSGSLSVIDLEAKELKKVIETGAGAEGVAVHPTRPEVWVSNRAADTVTIIDAESLDVVATLESPGFPIRVVFSQDGRHALVANARASGVRVFDAIERTKTADVKLEHELIFEEGRMFGRAFAESTLPIGILFHPDGGFAYVANTRSDVVSVIDTSEWKVVNHFKTDREPDGLGWSRRINRGESDAAHTPAQ